MPAPFPQEGMNGKPVVIRTLDIGGDKVMRDGHRMQDPESNPFLGNRSIRFLLDNPDVFRCQIRAVLRASPGGNLQLMYPMVATLEELRAANLLLGAIGGIYFVAYDSFYPLLIHEGNFQKAYSVSSTLETLTMVMVPVSTFIYKAFGILPLFLANAVTYLAAAVMETQIRAGEEYIGLRAAEGGEEPGLRRFTSDFREGMRYLIGEKGLLAVAVYFTFSSLTGGMAEIVTLPWFRGHFTDGEYVFALTWGMSSLARFLGGIAHYNIKLPTKAKYGIALAVYISIAVLEGAYLFTPVPVMMVMTSV